MASKERTRADHLTHAEQIAGRCKHFTGIGNDRCAAGVLYEIVTLRHEPMEYVSRGTTYKTTVSRPCLLRYNEAGAVCGKREFPTPEEVAAQVERSRRAFEGTIRARKAIVEKIGPYTQGESRDERGTVPCPVCESGTLGYSRAAFNGHVWGKCSTEGCVAWME